MTGASDTTDCRLCGLPAPAREAQEDGHAFCCFGCREVYRRFGDIVLPENQNDTTDSLPSEPEGSEAFLRIDGMHCSSCELLIEKIALQTDGILAASSSYATSTAKIIYDPEQIEETQIKGILSQSGYHARLSSDKAPAYEEGFPFLRLMVAESLAATVMMLYLAFFYPTHLGLVDLSDLEPVHWLAFKIVPFAMFFFTTILVFFAGAPIFRGAWIGLRAGVLNMDNLLAIAILAAYGYSIGQLLMGSLDLYFDVAATIVAVVTIGRYFEREAKAKATTELTRIMESWTPLARTRRDGKFQSLSLAELVPDDRVVIDQGEIVPVDGVIIDGEGAINESLMTGEPFPVSRGPGEHVLGGTHLVEGSLEIEVGHIVESQLDNLARVLWNAQSASSGAHGMADRVARVFVPVVLALALLVMAVMLMDGSSFGVALLAGMATLIVSCPCTFGLAIPLTTAAGLSWDLRHGIIITSADAFEKAPVIDIVAIDKTGTLSTGDMAVTQVLGPDDVIQIAAAVERLSPHPIAEAIARMDSSRTADDIENRPGKGAIATVDGRHAAVGSRSLFATLGWGIPDEITHQIAANDLCAGVVSYVGWDGYIHGAIITQDKARPEWDKVINELHEKCRVVLLTGAENPGGYEEGLDDVFAGIPPEGKAAVIKRLRAEGTVVMIGDGSNDAPALAAADLGIAFGAPTALAAEAADVVIPGDRLERVFTAFELIYTIRRRIRQNLGWALLYNATAIPLAVSGLLNPLFAALAMSTSSLLVIWNSSRPIGTAYGIAHQKTEPVPHKDAIGLTADRKKRFGDRF
ncbi:MAG: cation-translocating P-type ATPase [Rhodospirillaceae bacterium]|nr:cation-translocating P-type ATPase [Rhodospirillaceae bacterium]